MLSGYHPMLIIADDSQGVLDFIDRNYLDDDRNPDLYSFMQIVVAAGKRPLSSSDSAFLKARNLALPQPYHVVAYALDDNAGELAHLELDPRHSEAASKAAEFIRKETPPPSDAEAKWNAAFAEAKRSNRRVWARVSGRHCGPCFLLTRWFDDQHKLLEKDYVFVKFDDFHDKNGGPVAERLTLGKSHGIPFHAIFDSNEKMLIDSAGPSGNIGMPGGDEGKSHLRKMLLQTRRNLTDAEINQLIQSIAD
jgi:hypothetical protein